jgi:hypothetical protein
MQVDVAHRLRQARLAHVLLEAVPGVVLQLRAADGPAVLVGPVGDDRAEVLLCQHRAALAHSLAAGDPVVYAEALGLPGGEPAVSLLTPPGADVGSGLLVLPEDGARRQLCAVTTLCPRHAAGAIRAAHTAEERPDPGSLGGLRREVRYDPMLGVSLLRWSHRAHPTTATRVEDLARAEVAACVVEELLVSVAAGGDPIA